MRAQYGMRVILMPKRLTHKRQFLYFGAVSYRCRVYLNGAEIAEVMKEDLLPFQVEVTDLSE